MNFVEEAISHSTGHGAETVQMDMIYILQKKYRVLHNMAGITQVRFFSQEVGLCQEQPQHHILRAAENMLHICGQGIHQTANMEARATLCTLQFMTEGHNGRYGCPRQEWAVTQR